MKPTDRSKLVAQATRHSTDMDSIVSAFEEHVRQIVIKAQARTIAILQSKLTVKGGQIERTPANQKILRSVADTFVAEIKAAGYDDLVTAYVNTFGNQIPAFQQVLDLMGLPKVKFGPADTKFFAAQQLSMADTLRSVVESVSALAQQKILFSVGGLSFPQLAETLATKLSQTTKEAVRIADTALPVFYRTIADRGFRQIEQDFPEGSVRYSYYGPDDKVTRPFCRHLVEAKRTYTRSEIERMENKQLPNPFLTGGGWHCRHLWLLEQWEPDAMQTNPLSKAA